jgi:hypothetical protein
MRLPYKPSQIKDFFVYQYEWIDDLSWIRAASSLVEDFSRYESEIITLLNINQWRGNGEIGLIWIPPFIADKIIVGGEQVFLDRHPPTVPLNSNYSWAHGFAIWHAKQLEDGISFLCSPFELDIPAYGLKN